MTFKNLITLSLATLTVNLLVWLPHILELNNFYGLNFSNGFNTIYRNFDGLEYVIIAKSLYNPDIIKTLPQSLPHTYYASHFPLFSLFILFFVPFLGFLKSMLFITTLFTVLSTIAFFLFVKRLNLTNHSVLLSIIFLILPARWLIVHSVGSSEPMFIFFLITAMYFFIRFEQTSHRTDIFLTGIFGMFAQLTRPPGILLFTALALYIIWKELINKNTRALKLGSRFIKILKIYYPLLLIPLSLLGIFIWFHFAFNDFFAYFHSGDNIHLAFPPFQVFNKNQFWVGDIWLEDVVYILLLGFFGGILLIKRKLLPLGLFVLTYFIASSLIAHRDISRYTLPAFPFLLIAFEKVLTSKEFRIVLIIMFLAIYLYSQNYILQNTAPFPNIDAFN